jgi:Asp/Glu/hydantoin racemase
MTYRIEKLVFSDDPEMDAVKTVTVGRVVGILESHQARVSPAKWYVTVLTEVGP